MATNSAIPDVEKKILVASLIFVAAMLGLIAYAAIRLGISVPTCITNVKPFEEGELIRVGPGRYEAHVVAKTWSFKPNRIKVERGSVVDFYVTSKDIVHGFMIERTNVNLMAIPGAVNYAQARFDSRHASDPLPRILPSGSWCAPSTRRRLASSSTISISA